MIVNTIKGQSSYNTNVFFLFIIIIIFSHFELNLDPHTKYITLFTTDNCFLFTFSSHVYSLCDSNYTNQLCLFRKLFTKFQKIFITLEIIFFLFFLVYLLKYRLQLKMMIQIATILLFY